jgi:hypothetical protein
MRWSVWGEFGIAAVFVLLQANEDVATATIISRNRFIRAGTPGAKAPLYWRAYGTAEAVPSHSRFGRGLSLIIYQT